MKRSEALLGSLAPAHFTQLMAGHLLVQSVTRKLITRVLPTATRYYRYCSLLDPEKDPPADSSMTPSKCSPNVEKWWKDNSVEYVTSNPHTAYVDPLRTLTEFYEAMVEATSNSSDDHAICNSCWDGLKDAITNSRDYIWDEIPYFFSIRRRDPTVTYGYKHYL